MPSAPRFRTACVTRLWEGTRFADRRARLRMAADAEAFVREVERGAAYPEELVVDRVTRYRPERAEVGALVPGADLRADLAAFVARLTRREPLDASSRGGAMPVADAAAALGVALRTLARFREDGLVLHHVRSVDGAVRLACFPDALESYRAAAGARVERAGRTTRLGAEAREAFCIRAAAACASMRRPSLHALATMLAPDAGCSVRAARSILERDARVAEALGRRAPRARSGPGPRAPFAAHAWRMGASPARIAAHLGITEAAAGRAASRGQAALLRSLLAAIDVPALPVFALPDAAAAILAPESVRRGLPVGRVTVPAPAAAPSAARRGKGKDVLPEATMVVAARFLRWRSARAIEALSAAPGFAELDAVERDLRWSHRLVRAVALRVLPTALVPCAQRLGRAWADVPLPLQRRWAAFAAEESVRAIEALDLREVGIDAVRPAAVAAHGVELAIARGGPEFAPPQGDGPEALERVLATCVPWWRAACLGDGWLEAHAGVRAISLRLGGDGGAPRTHAETARELRTSSARATAAWYAALSAR